MTTNPRRARKGSRAGLHHHPKGSGIPRPEDRAPDPKGNITTNLTRKTISWG